MATLIGITGTGTGVGKTALSAACLLWAQRNGLKSAYYKPVQCGLSPLPGGQGLGGDAEWIQAKLSRHDGIPSSLFPITTQTAVNLSLAASPHLASEKQHQRLDKTHLASQALALAANQDCLVIEGAGGAAVPFSRKGWGLLDLPLPRLPWILACAPGLGTLHATRVTAAWMEKQGAWLAGFAFCPVDPETENSPASMAIIREDNRQALEDLLGLPCLGELPYLKSWAGKTPLTEDECRLLGGAMDKGLRRLLSPLLKPSPTSPASPFQAALKP